MKIEIDLISRERAHRWYKMGRIGRVTMAQKSLADAHSDKSLPLSLRSKFFALNNQLLAIEKELRELYCKKETK